MDVEMEVEQTKTVESPYKTTFQVQQLSPSLDDLQKPEMEFRNENVDQFQLDDVPDSAQTVIPLKEKTKKRPKPKKKKLPSSDALLGSPSPPKIISTKRWSDNSDDLDFQIKTKESVWKSDKKVPGVYKSTSVSQTLATASRIRELEAQLEDYHKLERSYQILKEDHAHLRKQYEQLESQISSKANQVFDNYRKEAEARAQASEKRIQVLQQENVALNQDLMKLKDNRQGNVTELMRQRDVLLTENETLKADVDGLERRVQFYEEVTSTIVNDISIDQDDKETWRCTTISPRGRLNFALFTSSQETNYAYEVREGTTCFEITTVEDASHPDGRVTTAVDQTLPPYVADAIEFKKEDSGKWFRKLLDWSFS